MGRIAYALQTSRQGRAPDAFIRPRWGPSNGAYAGYAPTRVPGQNSPASEDARLFLRQGDIRIAVAARFLRFLAARLGLFAGATARLLGVFGIFGILGILGITAARLLRILGLLGVFGFLRLLGFLGDGWFAGRALLLGGGLLPGGVQLGGALVESGGEGLDGRLLDGRLPEEVVGAEGEEDALVGGVGPRADFGGQRQLRGGSSV